MDAAIKTIVKTFVKSSKANKCLKKKEFNSLVKSQFSNILSDTDSGEAVNSMRKDLDSDGDDMISFDEYMKLIGYLAVSYSEQHVLRRGQVAKNDASGQVAQCAPDREEETPEANADAKEETKPEANEEALAASSAAVKVEAKAETKEEGETKPDVAKEEPAAVPEGSAVMVVVATKEEKVEITEKVEEAAEKVAAVVDEEVEKKTKEATS